MPFTKWRKFMVGKGKARAAFVGLIDAPDLTEGESATAAETILNTVTLKANALYKNGVGIRITAVGTFAANGNNKEVKVYLGATAVAATGTLTDNATNYKIVVDVFRTGVGAQLAIAEMRHSTSLIAVAVATPAEDETADLDITQKGTAASTAADITGKGLWVEALTQ